MTSFAKTFERILRDTRKALMVLLAMGCEDDDVSPEEHEYFCAIYEEYQTLCRTIERHNAED